METIRVAVAENEVLITEGLKSIVAGLDGVEVVAVLSNSAELMDLLTNQGADLIILDYNAEGFSMDDIDTVYRKWPGIHVLAITSTTELADLRRVLRAGVNGHILKCCDATEISNAIYSIHQGDKFFCGKVIDALDEDTDGTASCAPLNLSTREIEIIRMVAEGQTNKEIAEKLFLSAHTVMTHRKNIMNKLGINNTAGIVMYAVKENIISPNKFLFSAS